MPKTARLQAVEEELMEREIALKLLWDNLVKAQDRMKMLANKNRTKRQFEEEDWVYLRLQPYRQVSVRGCRPLKLPLFSSMAPLGYCKEWG